MRKTLKAVAFVVYCAFFAVLAGDAPGADDQPANEVGPNLTDEPLAATFSMEKAASFLDTVASNWTRERKCGTCHTNYAYLLARPSLSRFPSQEERDIRAFFERRVAGWDGSEKSAKPRWDTEVVATAAALAINDAATTGKLHSRTREALDRMWTLQRADGSWDWLKCNWPPYEHDDYYGVVFATIGVGTAPDNYRDTPAAQRGLGRIRGYFREQKAPDLHHRAFLLWASMRLDGLMTQAERDATIRELLALQREDGGWCLPSLGTWKRHDGSANDSQAESDGYGTGVVIYILRQAGVDAKDPALQKGIGWLQTHQRESGRWFTRSLSNDKYHYITHAGTGFAVLALESCAQGAGGRASKDEK
jgi:squalene-hopene/tetraprenyl-beta-curcumene cyclase